MSKLTFPKLFNLIAMFLLWDFLNAPIANAEESNQKYDCPANDPYEVKLLPDSKIIYLRVSGLCKEATSDVGKLLRDFFAQHPEEFSGIVLDLRKARIGYLSAVSGITSIFLPPGQTVDNFTDKGKMYPVRTGKYYYQYDQSSADYLAGLPETLKSKPIAVLVGAETKNAGDSIANSLYAFRKAVLFGEEFESGLSDASVINNPFYQEVIKNFPVTVSKHPNTYQKQYLNSTFIPKGCTRQTTDQWINAVQKSVVSKVQYPKESQLKNEGGYGVVRLLINIDGTIQKIEIENTTGSKYLDRAMLSAVSKTKYFPLDCATEENPSDWTGIRIPFIFQMN